MSSYHGAMNNGRALMAQLVVVGCCGARQDRRQLFSVMVMATVLIDPIYWIWVSISGGRVFRCFSMICGDTAKARSNGPVWAITKLTIWLRPLPILRRS